MAFFTGSLAQAMLPFSCPHSASIQAEHCVERGVTFADLRGVLTQWIEMGTSEHELIAGLLLREIDCVPPDLRMQTFPDQNAKSVFALCNPGGQILSIGQVGPLPWELSGLGNYLYLKLLVSAPPLVRSHLQTAKDPHESVRIEMENQRRRGGGTAALGFLKGWARAQQKNGIALASLGEYSEGFYLSRGFDFLDLRGKVSRFMVFQWKDEAQGDKGECGFEF
ncbi:MAG: hypothetical protein ACO3A2_04135 [Bdellovibrionia bacterium]